MKEWYLRQTPRDRLIVIGVGVLVLLGLLYAFLWHPLTTRTESATRAIATKTETLSFIQKAIPQLRNGNAGSNSAGLDPALQKLDAYQLVGQLVRRQKMKPPERIEPAGSGGKGARVQFSEVPFDELIKTLAEVELYGFNISTLNVSRLPKVPGAVSARINVEPQ